MLLEAAFLACWPNISKYCGLALEGAAGSVIEAAKLTPSIGICGTPAMTCGEVRPSMSSKVGVKSLAWAN